VRLSSQPPKQSTAILSINYSSTSIDALPSSRYFIVLEQRKLKATNCGGGTTSTIISYIDNQPPTSQ